MSFAQGLPLFIGRRVSADDGAGAAQQVILKFPDNSTTQWIHPVSHKILTAFHHLEPILIIKDYNKLLNKYFATI
jgi:hypothetical protein